MQRTNKRMSRQMLRSVVFAAAVMLPASASGPAFADAGVSASRENFAASFASLNTAASAFVPSTGMVDVTAIQPSEEPEIEAAGRSIGSGIASYYGNELAGNRTASGERFDPGKLTAAHRTLPMGSRVLVTNAANGKSVIVRINDRGPFHGNRVIDLSKSAASRIGLIARGSGRVEMALLD